MVSTPIYISIVILSVVDHNAGFKLNNRSNCNHRGGDMPPPDAPGPIIPTYAPDEETRAAAEVLEMLQKQQPTASLPKSSSLSMRKQIISKVGI